MADDHEARQEVGQFPETIILTHVENNDIDEELEIIPDEISTPPEPVLRPIGEVGRDLSALDLSQEELYHGKRSTRNLP